MLFDVLVAILHILQQTTKMLILRSLFACSNSCVHEALAARAGKQVICLFVQYEVIPVRAMMNTLEHVDLAVAKPTNSAVPSCSLTQFISQAR